MKFQSFLLFLFGVFAPVIAAAEYWISVASFKNRDSAESALVNAQVKSEQAFAVYGARTDKGYFFRVMAGPYPTIREAKRAQQTLSSNGLNAAGSGAMAPNHRARASRISTKHRAQVKRNCLEAYRVLKPVLRTASGTEIGMTIGTMSSILMRT